MNDASKATTSTSDPVSSEDQVVAATDKVHVSVPSNLHMYFDDMHHNCKLNDHSSKIDADKKTFDILSLATPKGPRVTTLEDIIVLQKNRRHMKSLMRIW